MHRALSRAGVRPVGDRRTSHREMRRSALACLAAVAITGLSAGLEEAAAQEAAPSNQLHYPLAEELAGMLRAADAKRAAGELDGAIDIYRLVLDSDKAGRAGYQIATIDEPVRGAVMPGAQRQRRYIGITEWTIASLRALPAEGVKLFRSRYDYRAGSAMAAVSYTHLTLPTNREV